MLTYEWFGPRYYSRIDLYVNFGCLALNKLVYFNVRNVRIARLSGERAEKDGGRGGTTTREGGGGGSYSFGGEMRLDCRGGEGGYTEYIAGESER